MKLIATLALIAIWLGCWPAPALCAGETNPAFAKWLAQFRAEARTRGISYQTLQKAFGAFKNPLPRVIALDRCQPEFNRSVKDYVAVRVSEQRIADGRRMLRRYPTWLGRVENQYRVQRRFLVALWGIETHYGKYTGNFPIIRSLATLAYDTRRGSYFRAELLAALHILDEGRISLKMMHGSWAGAFGQCQFMPSVFRRFAVDADGDRRIDLWHSVPDVLASAANYLSRSGWRYDQTWGRPVILPDKFDFSRAGLNTRLPLSRWQALGIRRSNGTALPRRNIEASLILPDGPKGRAYLVYENFRVLMTWNRSQAFAIAVGTLSDRLAGCR